MKGKMASAEEVNQRLSELKRDKKSFMGKYADKEYFFNAEIDCLDWVMGNILYCSKCGHRCYCVEKDVNRKKWLCDECRI